MKQIANNIYFNQVEQELAKGISVLIPLKGTSMFPFIRDGKDKVLLVGIKPDSHIQKLDIVLFRYKGRHILHRIISIKEDTLIIQGDGVYASREICSRNDIIAKAVEVHRSVNGTESNIIPTNSFKWKILSGLWFVFLPFRRYLIYIFRIF